MLLFNTQLKSQAADKKSRFDSTLGINETSCRSPRTDTEMREQSKMSQQQSYFSLYSSYCNIVQSEKEQKRLEDLKAHVAKITNPSQIVIKKKPRRRGLESQRGSKYRGVSKNGKKWQVQVQLNQRKKYKGQIKTERLAARVYDKRAIFAYGIKAKTNFDYTKA